MLQVNRLREHREYILEVFKNKRGEDYTEQIDSILELDQQRKNLQSEQDALNHRSNELSKQIPVLFKEGKADQVEPLKEEAREVKQQARELGEELTTIVEKIKENMCHVPNVPHESVPEGKDDSDNVVVKIVESHFTPPSEKVYHWDMLEKYSLADFESGVKITGAGFPLMVNKGARLQRALVNFFLDKNTAAGYNEVIPPLMVNHESAFGTGQLPDKEAQMYEVERDQLFVIPTSEVPLTNIFRGEILGENDFPQKVTAATPCFRREAGSYGKDVRGLNRLHQFEKVEIVRVEKPEYSTQALEEMKNHVAGILEDLELPYRVLRLCGGDLGFAAAITYDFEVYSFGQERWLEVSSVSNFEAYQANRLSLRYKTESGKTKSCHTLNGSALALPRIMAALIENNYYDGDIILPEKLHPYLGFDKISL